MNETWRAIPGWPDYEASSNGEIRRRGGVIRKTFPGKFGHRGLVLYEHGKKPTKQWVHRLVCAAFHGEQPKQGMHAAHINGVSDDNRPVNIRWASPSENELDKKCHGTDNSGSRNGMAVLTEEDATQIILHAQRLPRSSGGRRIKKGAISEVTARFGVSASCVRDILAGRRWSVASQSNGIE